MKNFLAITLLLLFFVNCQSNKKVLPDANQIINKTLEVSGADFITKSVIAFKFRTKRYKATRENGSFQFERKFKDNNDEIQDVLNNDGFERIINNESIKVADSMIPRYSASVNSVHYFSVLPYGLNDKAVNKKFLNEVIIKGKRYSKIEITFNQDGGGEDFEDVFVYWINSETFKADYLAYSYNESDGLGLRFREAYNERYINDIRFVDYNNYKPKDKLAKLFELDSLFETEGLKLLSKIELELITVN